MDLFDTDIPVPHEDGSFISERVSRIAELIQQYDRNLSVRWIPPNRRGADDPGFAIVESRPDGREFVAFYVQNEGEFDERVLERIFQSDAAKHGNLMSKIDASNAAVRLVALKKKEEADAERVEVATAILKSGKARYRHNGRVYE